MLSADEILSKLQNFHGCEVPYYRTIAGIQVTYTDGIKCLQEIADCYWLIDAIASYQTSEFKSVDYLQFWHLSVNLEEKSALLNCDDGNGNIRLSQPIEYTDFPLPEIKIWVDVSNEVFMMLPSEY